MLDLDSLELEFHRTGAGIDLISAFLGTCTWTGSGNQMEQYLVQPINSKTKATFRKDDKVFVR